MVSKILSKQGFYYISTGFIAIFVGLVGGIVDIIQTQGVIDAAQVLGYPLYFFFLLGVFKILGAIALFFPNDRIKDIAYAGFAFDFIFASFSHFSVGDPMAKIITPLIILAVLAISFILKENLKTKEQA